MVHGTSELHIVLDLSEVQFQNGEGSLMEFLCFKSIAEVQSSMSKVADGIGEFHMILSKVLFGN